MKTLALRELLRHPSRVRQITAQGESVKVTDNGRALWVVMPDAGEEVMNMADEAARSEWIDRYFDELSASPAEVSPSLSDLVLESRGDL